MSLTAARGGGLEEKVALITGATSGIGRAIALAFARAGARVVIADIRQRPTSEETPTAELICEAGGTALFVQTDVAEKSQVESLVQRSLDRFGRIDILVNNAGFGHVSSVEHIPDHVLRRLVEVNFYGVVYGVQAALPLMRAQGSGHIINVSSGASMLGLPYASVYAATKAAIMRFSEALRYELEGSGIRVSVVYPDFTATDLALETTPGGGIGTRTVRSLNPDGLRRYGRPRSGIQSPERVARHVLACVLRPRNEVYLSSRIRFHGLFRLLFPAAIEHEAREMKRSVEQLLEKLAREGVRSPENRTLQH